MARLKFSFTLKKQALITSPKKPGTFIEVGDVVNYSDVNGAVFITIEFKPGIPKEVIDFLQKNPKLISIIGHPSGISEAELTDLIDIVK